MKRLYSLIILTLTLPSMLNAQQLPNTGFDNDWVKCKPWTSNKTKEFESTPSNWTISHVIGFNLLGFFYGSTKVGNEISGHDSSKAVSIYNSSNSVAKDQIVPGYLTLGTTWSTANTSGEDADGGTFGGIEFNHRPDAISFYYQRSHGTDKPDEKSSVVAYMWKGTYQQADVPGEIASKPKTVTMMDRDRNILGMETPKGGTVNSDGCERIAKINFDLDGDAADWTNRVIPFEYESANTPEKFNVIFSAGDYFSTTPGKDNTLNIDDIKLIYYSRLASLKVNGVSVNGFDPDKYDYTVDAEMPENSNAFVAECMGNSGSSTARIDLDKKNAKATITVTNANQGDGAVDEDGNASHVYTVQFNKTPDTPTGIDSIEADDSDTPAEYYNLQGTRVSRNSLIPGIYIRRQGTKTTKIIVQ